MSDVELFSTENETAILSILLNNPDKVFSIINLKTFMFSSTPNQVIFDTITELSSQNLIPDHNLIINYLTSTGKIKNVGGIEYIQYLKSREYNPDNLKEFEKLLVNAYKGKTIISLASKLPSLVMGGNDIDSVIGDAKNTLDTLMTSSGGESTQQLSNMLKDGYDRIVEKIKNPGIVGIPTGYNSIDLQYGGITPGEVWVVGGRPSMGKSSWIINSLLNTSRQGNSAIIFSKEMSKQQIIERMLAVDTKIQLTDIRLGLLDQPKIDRIADTIVSFKSLPVFVDTNFFGNIDYVISTIRRYKSVKDVKLVYIDYLQLLAERDTESTQELGKISRELKLLANELQIGIVLLSQLNRGVESRDDKRPVLSDLRQSGNIEEDADVVAFLYRDSYYNKDSNSDDVIEFIVRKNREGPIGTIPLGFEAKTTYVYDR